MPIDKAIQDKVLKIAANAQISSEGKLAIRKKFYELKIAELGIEADQNNFNSQVSIFNKELDEVLKAILKYEASTQMVDPIEEKIIPQKEVYEPSEIITSQKEQIKIPGGLKVRMQEEINNTTEETNDFEVPFEMDETD